MTGLRDAVTRACRGGRRSAGFVLLAALWLIVALAAVGLDASLRSKTRRLAAANVLDDTRARAAAVAGESYARAILSAVLLDRAGSLREEMAARNAGGRGGGRGRQADIRTVFRSADPSEDPWREPQEFVPRELELEGARLTLRVRDAESALNLNSADAEMLRAFFAQGLGVDYIVADGLAQAIVDWRDEDDIARANGAERAEYLAAGAAVLPPNRNFAELAELRNVMGMTAELFEAARPFLTLAGPGRININAAPVPVLASLPGMTTAGATEIVRLRESGEFPRNRTALLRALPRGVAAAVEAEQQRFDRRATFTTEAIELVAEGIIPGSPIRARVQTTFLRSNTGAVAVERRTW